MLPRHVNRGIVQAENLRRHQAREPFPWYQHEQIGYNYRLSNVSAGIGRGQMRVVDNHIAHRRAIHRLYTELLAGLPGITVVEPKKSTMFLPN